MEKAVAVKVELKQRWHGLAGCDGELSIAVCTAGHVDAVSQKVEGAHDHILRVPREAKVKVPWQDLLLHVEKVFHQLGQHHPLEPIGLKKKTKKKNNLNKSWVIVDSIN